MTPLKNAMINSMYSNEKHIQQKRQKAIENEYMKMFNKHDYSTEEYTLSPDEMYEMLERCISEGKAFSEYVKPLDPNVIY